MDAIEVLHLIDNYTSAHVLSIVITASIGYPLIGYIAQLKYIEKDLDGISNLKPFLRFLRIFINSLPSAIISCLLLVIIEVLILGAMYFIYGVDYIDLAKAINHGFAPTGLLKGDKVSVIIVGIAIYCVFTNFCEELRHYRKYIRVE